MSARCGFRLPGGASCDAKKLAPVHSRHHPDHHPYADPSKPGLHESEGRKEYRLSQPHRDAYEAAAAPQCLAGLAGAPGRCTDRMTPHHVAGRGSSGGLEAAERIAPVITLCSYHNSAIEGVVAVRRWAERNTFVRDGVEWPFRLRAKRVQAEREGTQA